MLRPQQTSSFCLPFGGSQRCRYLGEEDGRYYCLKMTAKKAVIDAEVEEYKKCPDNYNKQSVALGNNCSGFPLLKHIWQG